MLRPLRAITGTAQRISATSPHERLALAGPDDEPADLAKVVTACLESAVAQAERRGLHVETALAPAPMLGDPDLITRLVDNAVRHNVPGGTVEVDTAQRDGQAVLTVANDGPVIPSSEIGRLMQSFQRLAARQEQRR